jgi:pyrroloquinoline quinone (PQQ) biosynthesis protein C
MVLAERAFREHPIERHPLFVALEEDRLPEAVARRVACQIFHVVDHFPRLIAALLAALDDYRLRLPLVDNLYAEHGRMDPRRVHVETYRAFLEALGVDDDAVRHSRPSIGVVAYNRALLDLCMHQPAPEALAALGAVEETVARTSPIVGRWAARRGLHRAAGASAHFSEHEELDLRHAQEIYEIAGRLTNAQTRPLVLQGLELGRYYHCRLYTDLLAEAVQS